jgi:lipid A 4'-phosphatase
MRRVRLAIVYLADGPGPSDMALFQRLTGSGNMRNSRHGGGVLRAISRRVNFLFPKAAKIGHGVVQMGPEVGLQDKVLWRLVLVTAAIHLVFSIWPAFDIAVSRAFVQPDGSFWLSKSVLAEEIRKPIWLVSVCIAICALLMLSVSLIRGSLAQTPWRLWAFVATLYVIGPGLLVNVLLKQNWGRARPVTIEEFGGTKLFTPPFEIAGQCSANCSFVSGEAASAAVMVIVLAIFFRDSVPRKWRPVMYAGLAALFVLAAGMRVATGRHFLSDVMFAGLFMLIIARVLYCAFDVPALRPAGLLRTMLGDIAGLVWPIVQPAADPVAHGVVAEPVAARMSEIALRGLGKQT